MHTALWVLAATSVVGAGVSLLRPKHGSASDELAEDHRPPIHEEPILERVEATP
jgi:hypothetical protein